MREKGICSTNWLTTYVQLHFLDMRPHSSPTLAAKTLITHSYPPSYPFYPLPTQHSNVNLHALTPSLLLATLTSPFFSNCE